MVVVKVTIRRDVRAGAFLLGVRDRPRVLLFLNGVYFENCCGDSSTQLLKMEMHLFAVNLRPLLQNSCALRLLRVVLFLPQVAVELVNRSFEITEKNAKIVACTQVKLGKYGCVVRDWRQLFAKDIASMTYLPERETASNRDGGSHRTKILVAKMCLLPNSRDMKQLLRDYLTDFHVRLHGATYSLRRGVLQGGMLSADIADVYMAELQRRHLASFGNVPGELLIRATDDFLYVTSDRESACRFLDAFARGFPDFGLVASPSKVQTNVVTEPRGGLYNLVTSCCVTDRATFCGLVFDMRTMEVFREPVASLPVASLVGKPDRQPGEALKNYLAPWHVPLCPLALDPEINSRDCVIAGLLDCFAAFADRFFYSLSDMPYVDDRYVVEVLLGVSDNFLVRMFRWASNVGAELPLSVVELSYLFLEVSSRKANCKARTVGKRIRECLKKVRRELASTGDVKALKAFVDLVLS
ncbi:hypothetical protein HPB48_013179 [Haemaphysalis longicornis]|uniref:Telomerase reverse transcriptase n=1 Tax=Haemaphysalis longicornis TaxID=44386 RepID=A0A9J6GUM1_HAELO|nr:hypothetical protein HPB48_013179 [Haemaphysalis longicornis]